MGNKKSIVPNNVADINEVNKRTIIQLSNHTRLWKRYTKFAEEQIFQYIYSIATIEKINKENKTLDITIVTDRNGNKNIQLNNIAIELCLIIEVYGMKDKQLLFSGYIRQNIDDSTQLSSFPSELISLLINFQHVYNTNNIEFIVKPRVVVPLNKEYAIQSCGVIKDICMIKNKDIISIRLTNLEYGFCHIFDKIVAFIEYHKGKKIDTIKKPIRSVKMCRILSDKFDAEWVNTFDKHTLYSLIELSLALKMNDTLQICLAKVATLLHNKRVTEMKNILSNDTDEEIDWFKRFEFYIAIKTEFDTYLHEDDLKEAGFKTCYF
eukprot:55014_1